jgi:hypothetical protein
MIDFFDFWETVVLEIYPGMKLVITFHKVADYCIDIGGRESNKPYYSDRDGDFKRLLAKAYIWLTDYLLEKKEGY